MAEAWTVVPKFLVVLGSWIEWREALHLQDEEHVIVSRVKGASARIPIACIL